jgi:hypothetical protein
VLEYFIGVVIFVDPGSVLKFACVRSQLQSILVAAERLGSIRAAAILICFLFPFRFLVLVLILTQ